MVLCYGLRLSIGCVGLKASWEGLSCRPSQPLPVPSLDHLLKATKQSEVGSCLCWAQRHVGEAAL